MPQLILFYLLGQSPWGMAICLVWQSVLLGKGMVETGPFFARGRTVDSGGGGGWKFFKKNILAVKHLKINNLAWVPRMGCLCLHIKKGEDSTTR